MTDGLRQLQVLGICHNACLEWEEKRVIPRWIHWKALTCLLGKAVAMAMKTKRNKIKCCILKAEGCNQ